MRRAASESRLDGRQGRPADLVAAPVRLSIRSTSPPPAGDTLLLTGGNSVVRRQRGRAKSSPSSGNATGGSIFPRTFFQGGDPFLLEKKATHFSGPWEVASIRKFAPQMDFGVGHRSRSRTTTAGPVYTYGDYKNISIFSTTTHPKEAWEFVKFLVDGRTRPPPPEASATRFPSGATSWRTRSSRSISGRTPPWPNSPARRSIRAGWTTRRISRRYSTAIAQEYESCAVYGRLTRVRGDHVTRLGRTTSHRRVEQVTGLERNMASGESAPSDRGAYWFILPVRHILLRVRRLSAHLLPHTRLPPLEHRDADGVDRAEELRPAHRRRAFLPLAPQYADVPSSYTSRSRWPWRSRSPSC
jgi:hypothetical protein